MGCECLHDDITLGSCKPLPPPYLGLPMPWAELHCVECCKHPDKWKAA